MTAHETKTFRSGNSVAVRLPKELGFEAGIKVQIEAKGTGLVIRPFSEPASARQRLEDFIRDLKAIGRPGIIEEREPIEAPDRPGLY